MKLYGLTSFLLFLPAAVVCRAEGVVAPDTLTTLPDIDVVAVKQQADLSLLPMASTSVGQTEVERLDLSDLKKFSDIAPNFYIPEYGSRITSSIYVRGVGARMDQPAVGLNIDNIPVLNKDAYDLDIPDIARVEILRGAQSSLYGRNTMTGLINISTLSPMRFQGWKVMAQGAMHSSFKASAGWYHLFNSNLGLSATAGFLSNAGEYRNSYDNSRVGKEMSGNLRIRTDWRPSSTFRLSNTIYSSLLRQGGYPYESVATGKIEYNDTCFYRRFILNDGLTIDARVGELTLVSVTSVQHLHDNMTLDQDFLPLDYFTLTQKKRETSLTEDLMLKGEAASGKYRWLAGTFLFYRHLNMEAPVTFKDTGVSSLIEHYRNEANPFRPIAWNTREFPLNSDFTMPSWGAALYHESRFDTGRWHFSAGLRLDLEHVAMDYHSYCSTGYMIYDNPAGTLPVPDGLAPHRQVNIEIDDHGHLSKTFLTILPKVSALFDLDEAGDSNAYIAFGRGYKAGGFNTQMFSDVLQQRLLNIMGMASLYETEDIVSYKPEECWNLEAGAHLSTSDKSLQADIALFYMDIHNQQLTMFPDGTTTGRIMTNAGRTRSLGGELSLTWRPVDRLTLTGNYGYTNARFVDFFNGRENLKGKQLPYAPSNTLWLQALYSLTAPALKDKTIIFDINLRGNGPIQWNEENTLSQDFYALLGASVTLNAPHWEVQLWGKNLTDTRHHTFYFMSMGNEFVQRGPGITAGITVRLSV